jgi:predicted transport protein
MIRRLTERYHHMRITLNIEPHTVIDPRAMVSDVTDLGVLGNGNSEVRLNQKEDLPYVIGLARQALEQQLTSEAAE